LLSFRPTIKQTQTQTGILAMLAALVHKSPKTKNVFFEIGGFNYEGDPLEPWPPADVSPSDPQYKPPTSSTSQKEKMLAFWDAIYHKMWARGRAMAVLGALATNISGQATVLGTPFLRAGMLVGFSGLSPGPENEPDPNNPQRIVPYSRVYLVKRCIHRVDQKGLYLTKLEVGGATTDNSADKIAQKLASGEELSDKDLQSIFNQLVGQATEGLEGFTAEKAWYFKVYDWFKGVLGFGGF
ncbi:MAG: hypothetical protein DRN68_07245, partial [Thaumarchaeota archaeon]